jgi:hypothetical protein
VRSGETPGGAGDDLAQAQTISAVRRDKLFPIGSIDFDNTPMITPM